MMNKKTRKLSKIPADVRAEIEPYFIDRTAIADEDGRRLPKLNDETADYVRKGLTVRLILHDHHFIFPLALLILTSPVCINSLLSFI